VSFSFQFHVGTFLNFWPHLIVPKDGRLSSEMPHDGKWNQPECQVFGAIARWEVTALVVHEPHVGDSRFCVPSLGSADVEHGPRPNSERERKKAQKTNCTPTPHHTSNWHNRDIKGFRTSIRTTRSVASDEAVLLCSQGRLGSLVICMHPQAARLGRVDLKSSLRVDFAAEAGTGRDANLPSPLGARREQMMHFMCSLSRKNDSCKINGMAV